MRLSRLFCALVFAGLIYDASGALAQDCTCSGNPMGTQFNGGNGQPLKWLFSPYLMNSPQRQICYFKQVSNLSNADVRDVRWEVANFFRRMIPKGKPSESCPVVAGDPKQAPTNGPLYFGSSSEAYDTTVLQPQNGWGESASNSGGSNGPDVVRVADVGLNTVLTFFVEDRQGKAIPGRLTLASSAKSADGKTYLNYSVANNSEAPFGILVNLSASKEILERVPMLQRVFWMKPGEKRVFDASAEGQNSTERAAIVVFDEMKNISAIDSASFYTVTGRKEVPDESFWKQLR